MATNEMSPVMKEKRVMKKKVTRVAAVMKRSMQLVSPELYSRFNMVNLSKLQVQRCYMHVVNLSDFSNSKKLFF